MSEWISIKDDFPDLGEEVEISFDGINSEGDAAYIENRHCMMAGHAGGFGYFGEGFATISSKDCEGGLILNDVTHWQPLEGNQQ